MNSSKKPGSFSDPRTFIAIILTFFLFFGWQIYLKRKYPDSYKKKAKVTKEVTPVSKDSSMAQVGETESLGSTKDAISKTKLPQELGVAKILNFSDENLSFDISSHGMALERVILNKFNRVASEPFYFPNSSLVFPTKINGKVVEFDVSRQGDKFVGKGFYKNFEIIKVIEVNSDKFFVGVKVYVDDALKEPVKLSHDHQFFVSDPKKILFFPTGDRNEFYTLSEGSSDRETLVSKTNMESPETVGNTKVVSFGNQYFSTSFVNEGNLIPSTEFFQEGKDFKFSIDHLMNPLVKVKSLDFKVYMGPKRFGTLSDASPDLAGLVNFSYLGFIAKPILAGLDYLYGVFGNYGLAVIVLTFLIRLMILPLALTSYRSMKKMQVIQPELKRIKEAYKDQPEQINLKTMELFKEKKVNPLGGCLPLLIQAPIFFAFYRGLSESVDLYQAPFFGWITDLSKMDPYFIFPILSVGGMVAHQIFTPSTMDKIQKRAMIVMTISFGVIFSTLPSALTLYMAVSSWFGVAQHLIFLRERKGEA